MAENPAPAGAQKRMQTRGYRAVTVYLKKPTANILKLYCKTLKKSQSDLLRDLAEERLRREGLLE
jgi:hypothetical protein